MQHLWSKDYFGIFNFRFYHLGEWSDVVIDDFLPTLEGKLIFSSSKDHNEFWPALLEKAYAKYVGNYAKLSGGSPLTAALHFCEGFSNTYETSEYQDKIQELFEDLKAAKEKSSIVTCSTHYFRDRIGKESVKLGLRTNHAYVVTGLCQIEYESISKNVQLIRIHNPWGCGEWMGAWSDYSDEMKSLTSIEKEQIDADIEDDGEFYMDMNDFVKVKQN